jgi:hypothetical protein
MELAPFGVPYKGQKSRLTGLGAPMYEWRGTQAEFRRLLDDWMAGVQDTLWPVWNGRDWAGKTANGKEAATRAELALAVGLYHGTGGPDILTLSPEFPGAPTDCCAITAGTTRSRMPACSIRNTATSR